MKKLETSEKLASQSAHNVNGNHLTPNNLTPNTPSLSKDETKEDEGKTNTIITQNMLKEQDLNMTIKNSSNSNNNNVNKNKKEEELPSTLKKCELIEKFGQQSIESKTVYTKEAWLKDTPKPLKNNEALSFDSSEMVACNSLPIDGMYTQVHVYHVTYDPKIDDIEKEKRLHKVYVFFTRISPFISVFFCFGLFFCDISLWAFTFCSFICLFSA